MAQGTFLEGPVFNSIGAKNAAIEFAGPQNSIAAFSARLGLSFVGLDRSGCWSGGRPEAETAEVDWGVLGSIGAPGYFRGFGAHLF